MMTKISITLPDATVAALDGGVQEFKRSQFLHYAASAMLARLRGDNSEALRYEHAARVLVVEARESSRA